MQTGTNFLGLPNKKKKPLVRQVSFLPKTSGGARILGAPIFKAAKRYWGDKDKDGVINGLDCAPHNKKKQGALHNIKKGISEGYYAYKTEQTKDKIREKFQKMDSSQRRDLLDKAREIIREEAEKVYGDN